MIRRPILSALTSLAALATGALLAGHAGAFAASPCPAAAEVSQRHLLGLWRAEFEGLAQGATLLLERHPEMAENFRGAINRNGERALLAGDVTDGDFNLEESANGVNISAAWVGEVVDGSCGREIRGAWKAEGEARQIQFILRKL